MVDLHSHFLPGIDDGAKDAEMSLALLKSSVEQGVTGLVATPHCYSQEPVERFLAKRQAAFEQIAGLTDLPIALGAEVYYRPSLIEGESLYRLTMGGSPWLLLELPFAPFNERIFHDVAFMADSMGLQIIIAHLERYVPFNSWREIERLCAMNVTIQVNAADLESRPVKKMLKQDLVHFIASDMHNPATRPQTLGPALASLGDSAEMYTGNADFLFDSLPQVYLRGQLREANS